jgi:hypothetical protein
MSPRILLATPTFDGKAYCLDFWLRTVREIQQTTPCDVLLVDNSPGDAYTNEIASRGVNVLKSPAHDEPIRALGEARRLLYRHAIERGYDYLFSLEQDLFPPPDIIRHLLSIRTKLPDPLAVVAAPYIVKFLSQDKPPYHTVDALTSVATGLVRSQRSNREVQALVTGLEMSKNPGVHRFHSAGLGCALLDVPLLSKVEVRYSQEERRPDDAYFYQDLERLGVPVHVDTRLLDKVIHIPGNVHSVLSWWSMATSVKNRKPRTAAPEGGPAKGD